MRGNQERCLAAGINAYISRPIEARQLFEAIEALIQSVQPHA